MSVFSNRFVRHRHYSRKSEPSVDKTDKLAQLCEQSVHDPQRPEFGNMRNENNLEDRDILISLKREALTNPDKPALIESGAVLTYRELDLASDNLAGDLSNSMEGGVFLYWGSAGLAAHVYMLSCLKAGKAFLKLNQTLTPKNIRSITADLQEPPIVYVEKGKASFDMDGLTVLEAPFIRYSDTRRNFDGVMRHSSRSWIAVYHTTSGSTGAPKIVPCTYGDLDENLKLTEAALDIGADDVVGNPGEASLEHLLVTLLRGATMSFCDVSKSAASSIEKWLNDDGVTVLLCYIAIFRAFHLLNGRYEKLRAIGTYGDVTLPIDIDVFERLCRPGAEYHSFLALQEIAYVTRYTHRCGDARDDGTLPMGKPVIEDSVLIVDENGQPVAPGEIGEILVTRPLLSVFLDGYVGGKKGSGRLLLKGESTLGFATGDLAWIDDVGNLHFAGRRDDQVKLSGFNVRLIEVEQTIAEVDEIDELAITVHGGRRENRVLCCHYSGTIEPLALKERLRAEMPAFMVPHHFRKVMSLPRTATGKVKKHRLRLDLDEDQTAFEPSSTNVSDQLHQLWHTLLGHRRFDRRSRFNDVGGDSLALIKMSLSLEQSFGFSMDYESFERAGMSISGLEELVHRSLKGAKLPVNGDAEVETAPLFSDLVAYIKRSLSIWDTDLVGNAGLMCCDSHGGRGLPLIWIFQTELEFKSLTSALGSDFRLYGLKSFSGASQILKDGTCDDLEYYTTEVVSATGELYAKQISKLDFDSPVIIGGNCQASLLAEKTIEVLRNSGIAVAHQIILNALYPPTPTAVPTTLVFGHAEYEDFLNIEAPIQRDPHIGVKLIDGVHGQYFEEKNIGQIVKVIEAASRRLMMT